MRVNTSAIIADAEPEELLRKTDRQVVWVGVSVPTLDNFRYDESELNATARRRTEAINGNPWGERQRTATHTGCGATRG